MAGTDERLLAWERRTGVTLTMLSVLFLVCYAVPVLWPESSPSLIEFCEVSSLVIWAVFAVDIVTRFSLARSKWAFLKTHGFDLIVIALPLLRQLRAVRLVVVLMQINRRAEAWTRGRLALYVGATTTLLTLVGGLAVLDAERTNPDANITSYGDALWWGVATLTTVGYGDRYPTTVSGRVVALCLMIGGIGLIGFVTGSLATWIVDRISAHEGPAEATTADVALIMSELRELRAELAELKQVAGPTPPQPPGGRTTDD